MTSATNPERGIDSVAKNTIMKKSLRSIVIILRLVFCGPVGGNVFNPPLSTTSGICDIPHCVLFSSPSIQCHGENVKNANVLDDHNLIYSDSGMIPGDMRVVRASSSCAYNSSA